MVETEDWIWNCCHSDTNVFGIFCSVASPQAQPCPLEAHIVQSNVKIRARKRQYLLWYTCFFPTRSLNKPQTDLILKKNSAMEVSGLFTMVKKNWNRISKPCC